jgi:hypothetical protein
LASVRFHLDEHQSTAVARALERFGINAETTTDAGLIGASDPAHLVYAHAHGRVVVTNDSDFLELHYSGVEHGGIVFFPPPHRSIGEMVESLRLVFDTYTAEEMVGRLEYM